MYQVQPTQPGYSRRSAVALCAAVLASWVFAITGCGGGGSGPTPTGPATVSGRVVEVTTGQPTASLAKVMVGTQAVTTNADGTFTVANVPAGAVTITVTDTGEITRTFTATVVAKVVNNLGDVFLSTTGYTANVTGRVVTTVNGSAQPVANAQVTIGNVQGVTGTDGTFTLQNLPVGLGAAAGFMGKVTAQGFDDKPITADNLQFALVAGSNNIGDLLISVSAGNTPPTLPYTIKGVVTVNGQPTNSAQVSILANGNQLGIVTTDAKGGYSFWVAAGTYTISAAQSGLTTQAIQVTVTSPSAPVTAPTINLH